MQFAPPNLRFFLGIGERLYLRCAWSMKDWKFVFFLPGMLCSWKSGHEEGNIHAYFKGQTSYCLVSRACGTKVTSVSLWKVGSVITPCAPYCCFVEELGLYEAWMYVSCIFDICCLRSFICVWWEQCDNNVEVRSRLFGTIHSAVKYHTAKPSWSCT